MANSSIINLGEWPPDSTFFNEPPNVDLGSGPHTVGAPVELFEFETHFDHDTEPFSRWFQFPGDHIDLSPHMTTELDTEQKHMSGHQPYNIETSDPSAKSGGAFELSTCTVVADKTLDGCSEISMEKGHLSHGEAIPQGPSTGASWMPSLSQLITSNLPDSEQIPISRKRCRNSDNGVLQSPDLMQAKRQRVVAPKHSINGQIGLTEASFFEDWLAKFPSVFPGTDQFIFLAGLTRTNIEIVESWFNERLRSGRAVEPAEKFIVPPTTTDAPSPETFHKNIVQPIPQQHQLTDMKIEASKWIRERKAKKCNRRNDLESFIKDLDRPYCCTLGCGSKFKDRDDWRKHEERNYPQGGWICDLGLVVVVSGCTLCSFCGILNPPTHHVHHGRAVCNEKAMKAKGRLHFRKQHFRQHFINIHPGIPYTQYLENNYFTVESKFPRRCGFCRYLSKHWRDRIQHIGGHFAAGQDMSQWDFGVEDDEFHKIKDADDADPDGDGGFNGKRPRSPRDTADSSDDDSNNSSAQPVPKQRRIDSQHAWQRQSYRLTSDVNLRQVDNLSGTSNLTEEHPSMNPNHIHLVQSPLDPEPSEVSHKSPSIGSITVNLAINERRSFNSSTASFLRRNVSRFPTVRRSHTFINAVKVIERQKQPYVSHFLQSYESSLSFHRWSNLSVGCDLTNYMRHHNVTLQLSAKDVVWWCRMIISGVKYVSQQFGKHGYIKLSEVHLINNIIMLADFDIRNVQSNMELTESIAQELHVPEIFGTDSETWNASIISLGTTLLDTCHPLQQESEPNFRIQPNELFLSNPSYYEGLVQFNAWILSLQKLDHVTRALVILQLLNAIDTMAEERQMKQCKVFLFPRPRSTDGRARSVEILPQVVSESNDVFPTTAARMSRITIISDTSPDHDILARLCNDVPPLGAESQSNSRHMQGSSPNSRQCRSKNKKDLSRFESTELTSYKTPATHCIRRSELGSQVRAQSRFCEQDALEVPRNQSQHDYLGDQFISRTFGPDNHAAGLNENFPWQSTARLQSSTSKGHSRSYTTKVGAWPLNWETESYQNRICSSFDLPSIKPGGLCYESNAPYDTLKIANSLDIPDEVFHFPENEEPVEDLSTGVTKVWLHNALPYDTTVIVPNTEVSSSSYNSMDVGEYNMISAQEFSVPWLSTAEYLASMEHSFLTRDPTPDLTECSSISMSSDSYNVLESETNRYHYQSDTSRYHSQRKGRRVGPLEPEIRRKANQVRKVGSCWHCRLNKVACSIDKNAICANCTNAIPSPWKGRLCIRTRLKDYVPFFLPETMIARYSETALGNTINNQIEHFTNNRIEIFVSSGPNYPPIKLLVHEFVPRERTPLQCKHGLSIYQTYSYEQPLALLKIDVREVKRKLSQHIKAVIKLPQNIGESIRSETSMLSYRVNEAVNKYRFACKPYGKDRILKHAAQLYAMYYFMSRLVLIQSSSALQAFAKLQQPHVLPYNKNIFTSKMINLQLKSEMLPLLSETVVEVLHGLETTLERTRGTQSTWAMAFGIVVVICSCLETVEVATDFIILRKSQKEKTAATNSARTQNFRELEHVVFEHIMLMFQSAYKSHKSQEKGGFNPIRDGLEINEHKGITPPMVQLVEDVRGIVKAHETDINDRAKDPEFDTEPDVSLEGHLKLGERLSGRLLSKLLKGFGTPAANLGAA